MFRIRTTECRKEAQQELEHELARLPKEVASRVRSGTYTEKDLRDPLVEQAVHAAAMVEVLYPPPVYIVSEKERCSSATAQFWF